MVVERIEPVSDLTAGNVLYPRVVKMSERKRHIEQIFEDVRIEKFPHLPSRLHSVYVYPQSEHNYKSVWLNYKYSHSVTIYNLIEAEVDVVYWFDATYYNMITPKTPDDLIRDYAIKYWESLMTEDEFAYDKDVEGLCDNAVVKSCVQEYYPGYVE